METIAAPRSSLSTKSLNISQKILQKPLGLMGGGLLVPNCWRRSSMSRSEASMPFSKLVRSWSSNRSMSAVITAYEGCHAGTADPQCGLASCTRLPLSTVCRFLRSKALTHIEQVRHRLTLVIVHFLLLSHLFYLLIITLCSLNPSLHHQYSHHPLNYMLPSPSLLPLKLALSSDSADLKYFH